MACHGDVYVITGLAYSPSIQEIEGIGSGSSALGAQGLVEHLVTHICPARHLGHPVRLGYVAHHHQQRGKVVLLYRGLDIGGSLDGSVLALTR